MAASKKRILIGCFIALMLLCNIFTAGTVYADGPEDRTEVLTDSTVVIKQGTTEIHVGDTLTSEDAISIEISFGVPVTGDEPTPAVPVQKNDTATFVLGDAFKLVSSDYITLKKGEVVVGHVSFDRDDDTKIVTATVVFDGDDRVFNGTYNTVTCKFNATLEYDASGGTITEGNKPVMILNNNYTLNVPPAEIIYTVIKSATPNLAEKSIAWTVDIYATQYGLDIDLEGYRFFDDLADVGTLISGSFQVDGDDRTPIKDGTGIRYTFPASSSSPKQITFETEIPDDLYYASAEEQTITNNAQLQDATGSLKKEGQIDVDFTPEWIVKEGASSDSGSSGIYNPKDRTITWTITANQIGLSLDEVVITDLLPEGLTLRSAVWQEWNSSTTSWGAEHTISPNAKGEYEIGHISTMIVLTIVTVVPTKCM